MESSDLLRGKTYYQLTFADPTMTMPGVEALVYVGLADSCKANHAKLFCFQDTVSFVRFGFCTEYKGDEDVTAIFLPESDLDSIYNLDGIVSELLMAKNRADELGDVRLIQAEGTWV